MTSNHTSTNRTDRNNGIDAGRVLAFVGVVFIHAYAMGGPAAFWGAAWGRFAVPMFFIVSGYFLNVADPFIANVKRYSVRLLPVFVFWAAIYLVIYAAWPKGLHDWALLLIKGGRGNHLWFIPSLWLCLIVGSALLRTLRLRVTAAIALLLYVVGLAIGSYAPITGLQQSTWNPRDGLMFGLLLIVIGYAIRRYPMKMRFGPALAGFILFSVVHLTEFYIVSQYNPEYTDFFITTPALAAFAFLAAMNWRPAHFLSIRMAAIGRYSLGFYAIHMLFINLCKDYIPQTLAGWAACVVLVVALSIATTLALARVKPMQRLIS